MDGQQCLLSPVTQSARKTVKKSVGISGLQNENGNRTPENGVEVIIHTK
jgi:hypothetical protein